MRYSFVITHLKIWIPWGLLVFGFAVGVVGGILAYRDLSKPRDNLQETQVQQCESLVHQASESGILVYVSGAVKKPGVYTLFQENARIFQAIEKAGGFSSQANKSYIAQTLNMVGRVKDGERVYVPTENEEPNVHTPTSQSVVQENVKTTQKMNMNTATQQQLEQLSGIGETRAAQIIQGRPYSDLNDFIARSSLPNSIIDALESFINVSTD